jgi:hypothetical protein
MALPTYLFTDKILQNPYSKRVRKEIRKIFKQRLSHFDKVKFTKIYELFKGKSYRESFEMMVDEELKRFLYSRHQHIQSSAALFRVVEDQVWREKMPSAPTNPPKNN